MIALRGNVMQAFLEIYLILGCLTVFVFSQKEEWSIQKQEIFQYAECVTYCCNKNNISITLLDSQKVDDLFCWIISANYRHRVFRLVLHGKKSSRCDNCGTLNRGPGSYT